MPTHIHILAHTDDEEDFRRRLIRRLIAFSRRFGLGEVWQPVPAGDAIKGPAKVGQLFRYVMLNPCRKVFVAGHWLKLTDDPLAWNFSTCRDVVGGVADPWVCLDDLAWHGLIGQDGLEGLNRYVTSDPTVAVSGVSLPVPAPASDAPRFMLRDVCRAAAASTRRAPLAIKQAGPTRQAFLLLAAHQGWTDSAMLARSVGASMRTVQRVLSKWKSDELSPEDRRLLDSSALCLGDRRPLEPALLRPPVRLKPSGIHVVPSRPASPADEP